MNIRLTEDYVMTSDPYNIILNQEQTSEKGKKYLKALGFYPTVLQALQALVDKKMRKSTARTLNGLIRSHSELLSEIRGLFETVKPATG